MANHRRIAQWGLMFFSWPALCYSQILAKNSQPVGLHITLNWKENTGRKYSDVPGFSTVVILWPDHITFSRYYNTPEAGDALAECINNPANRGNEPLKGPDGKITHAGRVLVMKCQFRSGAANEAALNKPQHAVMLAAVPGPSKCNESNLPNGSYRICAALLERTPDRLRIEYEEDNKRNAAFEGSEATGNIYAYRARFDILLSRLNGNPLGDITHCDVKPLTAFSFDPNHPSKLTPMDGTANGNCTLENK